MCVYIHKCVHLYIYIYIYIYIHAHPSILPPSVDPCMPCMHAHKYTERERERHIYIYIYGAASPRRRTPPPWYAPPPPQATPLVPANIRHPRNCPPKLGLAPWPTGGAGAHGTTRQGTTGAGWGRITHNTGNHRAPSPSPSPSPSPPLRHTDDNDGDDVVHNDVDVLFPVWLLVVPFFLCCSGLRQRMFIALFS